MPDEKEKPDTTSCASNQKHIECIIVSVLDVRSIVVEKQRRHRTVTTTDYLLGCFGVNVPGHRHFPKARSSGAGLIPLVDVPPTSKEGLRRNKHPRRQSGN